MTSSNSSGERAPDPRPARTRAAIFAAARELSADDGEVTVNALAKRAGVSRAAFYSHFTGLDDLLGAMLQELLNAACEQARTNGAASHTIHQHVQHGFAMMAAYVERHQAFLRGALDWKSSHRTYMNLAETVAALHAEALRRMPESLPPRPGIEALARTIARGELVHADHWLVTTEEAARAGEELDATELLEVMLATAPSWYIGLGADEPIQPAELLASARTYGEDAADQH